MTAAHSSRARVWSNYGDLCVNISQPSEPNHKSLDLFEPPTLGCVLLDAGANVRRQVSSLNQERS